ncbi:hypothetical protein HPB49_019902 [Dermacentor silvarum]|uniref:Uncharacterized protein n=1 Tax=Dermacentor silvarum TaxID=543639 RepID=A0ACB8DFB8_DERSI|nr:hypothetical protein HPB49_019902 [Dermacentor silvarum]
MTVFAASEPTLTDVSLLEERAIARAILSTSSLPPSTPNHILTDSQAACRRFLFNTLHPTTTSILESFLSSTSHTFRLVWVPGHAAIPGNERARALVRELSHRAAGDRSAIIRPQIFSLSVGDNYRRILSRRPFSIPTSTPPVVQLNARTALTAPPYFIWSGFAKTFPTSLPFQTPPSPPGRSG